jgi:hypothetical protein
MGQAAKLVSSVAELAEMAKVANAAKLSLSNGEQLRQAADRIADLTQEMVDGHKGAAFAALDPALPGPDGWKGTPKPAME